MHLDKYHCMFTQRAVYTRVKSLHAYPRTGHINDITTLFMSLLANSTTEYSTSISNYLVPKAVKSMFPIVVHQRSVSLLAYPPAVYTRSKSLLAYPTTRMFLQRTQFLGTQGSKQYVLIGCALDVSTFYSVLNRSVPKAL